MSVDLERGIRIFTFSGSVTPADLEFVATRYIDREHYRFTDREIVHFAPDVSLAEIEAEDLGALADRFFEARRTRDDVLPDETIWVMPEQVRSEARLWREFTHDPECTQKDRRYVDTLEAAVAAYRLPDAWLEDIRQGKGFRHFGEVGTIAPAG
ncbi:hypothetical protein [Maricaulis sp.]|uniref:hypothetical protein n=1 Tax=Maricaulis sp. TaxID=1486257 RepID=UPI003A93B06E